MRNSWALERPLGPPFNDYTKKSINCSSRQKEAATIDTVSMNINRDLITDGYSTTSKRTSNYPSIDRRNKYNTLTPAEAKKMKRFLNAPTIATNRYQPTRTASVLHKPRAPPILVPNDFQQQTPLLTNQQQQLNKTTHQQQQRNDNLYESVKPTTANAIRCASACSNRAASYRDQRHSINYGQLYTTNRLYATNGQGNNNSDDGVRALSMMNSSNNRCSLRVSPSDSETNLSFRSSLDVMDSAYGSDRLQTLSVDLGNPTHHLNGFINDDNRQLTMSNGYPVCSRTGKYSQDSCSQDLNKLSDDSYSSAKSHQSESNKYNNSKSMSKNSLSSSTSKVFQNQLGNLKKFFRQMPIRRSFLGSPDHKYKQNNNNKQDLSESISQICLNRSQSPPVCPPPPRELKSMSYMETNSINYSNYDDFTKARNHQTSTLLRNSLRNQDKNLAFTNLTNNYCNGNENGISDSDNNNSPDNYSLESAWQLQSLPISYERNLTTVFEEKQNSGDIYRQSGDKTTKTFDWATQNNNNSKININHKELIRPPSNFDDACKTYNQNEKADHSTTLNDNSNDLNKNLSTSSTSLATTADSNLDYHRKIGTSFRFSYSQPDAYVQDNGFKNNGLPPRMPINNEQQNNNNSKKPLSLNGHSLSNNSLTNGISNSDQKPFSPIEHNSIKSLCDQVDYGITNGFDNDGDTTILSDTSTLHGDSNNMVYVNKCAELERTVESLKNKLITKEKEMTELQLKQWSADYLISQLKSTVVRLEKENAQLKAVVVKHKII